MTAPLDRVKALLAALPKEDQVELKRYLGDILLSEDEAEAIHLASLEEKRPGGKKVTYTYRQERVRCSKTNCWCSETGLGHGPYTYKYWREDGKLRKEYVGRTPPPSAPPIGGAGPDGGGPAHSFGGDAKVSARGSTRA